MRKKMLWMKWLGIMYLAFLMQTVTAQVICHDFETSLGNWAGFDAQATLATDNTSSNGTKFMRGRDQGGISWLRNVDDFGPMNCGGKICWRFKIITDDVSGQAINVSPTITLFSGVIGNMDLFATFTATSITVNEDSAWVEVCAPFSKTSPLGAMPPGWVMGNGGTVAQWNHLLTTINGIAFSTDIDPANDPGEVIGIDDVCVTINPPASCCDPTDTGDFTIETKCNNGVLTVTVTDPDPDPFYHWWSLMQTAVAGQTADSLTLNGGMPLVPTQTVGGTATFTISDFSKAYYIKHVIAGDFFNCFYYKEIRKPIDLPQSDVNFFFMNGLNQPRTEFCYGETIKLYAYNNIPITSYYIDAWRKPIDSPTTTPFAWYGGVGWATGDPAIIDLTAVFSGLSTPVYFEPGYAYEIKLAASNPNLCIGWTEVKHSFTVKCCPNSINAKFQLDPEPNPFQPSNTLWASGFSTFSITAGAVHEWYVFSSPNPSGGPYTLVTSLTTTTQNPVLLYNNAKYGLQYKVIHRVKTKCGEVCFAQTICANCRGTETINEVIDCSILDSLLKNCPVPTGLFGSCSRKVLVWNPVAGATSYVVEISYNDPACCRSSYQPTGMRYEITGASLQLFTILSPQYDCFRWRVKSKCNSKEESDWSAWQFYYCRDGQAAPGHDGGELIGKREAVKTNNTNHQLQPQVSPNPNNGEMTLSLQAPGDLVLSVDVINAQGMRVTNIARNTYHGGLFNYKLRLAATVGKGVYTVVFNTNYGTFRKKIIVN